MKNYNKILEAVNRGIQLALDDFDDEEQVLNIKSKQVQNRDYTKEYLDLMNEVVDLGLPSGTLWCKYNLGVNPNLLNTPEDWYGDYYAWGELKPNKKKYDWRHYDHGYGSYSLYKYVNDKKYAANDNDNKIDNLTELLPEDDAAYQFKKCHNFKFHIPTKELCEELKNYTTNYWVNNYNPNKTIHNLEDDGGIQGLNGAIFEGKNKNLLFIPAAGCLKVSFDRGDGSYCSIWSSSLFSSCPYDALFLYFIINSVGTYNDGRYCGRSIRPVIKL